MADRPLVRAARGIVHRVGVAYREANGHAWSEVVKPAERALRQWVADKYPRFRQYEGARGGRRGDGWVATNKSANAEIYNDIVKLRNRARDLVRNDPIAARIVSVSAAHVVNTGVRPKSNTTDPAVDKRVDDLFDAWQRQAMSDGLGFYAAQALAWRAVEESGEVLLRRVPRSMSDKLAVPLQLDLLESDYLDHTLDGRTSGVKIPDSHYLVQGVEFDVKGRRVAYHLWAEHPGNASPLVWRQTWERTRIPADDLAHMYRRLRPGQVRGITALAPVMWTLRQIGLYVDAELERKGTEALVTAIVTNAEGGRGGLGDLTTEQLNGRTQVIGDLEPGAVINVDGSTGVVFNHPQAMDPSPAIKGMLRRISTGVGQPYELVSGDLEGVNYSSIRYGTLPFRLGVWMAQEHVLIPGFCQPAWDWFVEAAIASGALPDRAYPVKWATPRWEEVDRLKEAMADVAEIRAGLRSYQDVLASRGEDWREVMDEAAAWLDAMTAAGLSFDSDIRRPETAAAVVAPDSSDVAPTVPRLLPSSETAA